MSATCETKGPFLPNFAIIFVFAESLELFFAKMFAKTDRVSRLSRKQNSSKFSSFAYTRNWTADSFQP
jgi:hypothetical protein